MAVKTYEGRILHKHDTKENWDKAVNFIPKISELIVYDADDDCAYPRLKIGDGATKVQELPFVADKPVEATEDEVVAALIDAGGLPALTVDGTLLSLDGSIITL